ncbi:MAG: hypothetical protein HYX92_13460 [Chloroflexi bacterium]|nr:hypothetical protein [Chloroflexota bacterium]
MPLTPKPELTVDKFLADAVEAYLFNDLESMAALDRHPGACGYPMLLATLAGMELLGGLLSSDEFCSKRGASKRLESYWEHYFADGTLYAGLSCIMIKLARNGLAHSSLVKLGIKVAKHSDDHLVVDDEDPRNPQLIIDPIQLFRDFKDSYVRRIKPILVGGDSETKRKMQGNLNNMIRIYAAERDGLFSETKVCLANLRRQPPDDVRRATESTVIARHVASVSPYVSTSGGSVTPFGTSGRPTSHT